MNTVTKTKTCQSNQLVNKVQSTEGTSLSHLSIKPTSCFRFQRPCKATKLVFLDNADFVPVVLFYRQYLNPVLAFCYICYKTVQETK